MKVIYHSKNEWKGNPDWHRAIQMDLHFSHLLDTIVWLFLFEKWQTDAPHLTLSPDFVVFSSSFKKCGVYIVCSLNSWCSLLWICIKHRSFHVLSVGNSGCLRGGGKKKEKKKGHQLYAVGLWYIYHEIVTSVYKNDKVPPQVPEGTSPCFARWEGRPRGHSVMFYLCTKRALSTDSCLKFASLLQTIIGVLSVLISCTHSYTTQTNFYCITLQMLPLPGGGHRML